MKLNSERMQCTEIVGSNLATSKAYESRGLNIYVKSSPFRNSRVGGGDVYYVTSCDSGRVTRLLLADISGHGETAAGMADSLKSSLQKNANRISQSNFVQRVNQEFTKTAPADQMATAVVATYFESEKRLALGMAGHPNPLLFRSSENRWHKIDEQVADNEKRLLNIPIGIDECSAYPTRNIRVEDGDMFLLYSDAFTESLNQSGSYLGISGLLEVLNDNHGVPHQDIIPTLTSRIRSLNPDNLNGDDATLILGHFTKAESNQTLKRELLTAS